MGLTNKHRLDTRYLKPARMEGHSIEAAPPPPYHRCLGHRGLNHSPLQRSERNQHLPQVISGHKQALLSTVGYSPRTNLILTKSPEIRNVAGWKASVPVVALIGRYRRNRHRYNCTSQTPRAPRLSIVIRPVNHHRSAQPHLRRLRFHTPDPQSCLHRSHKAGWLRPDHRQVCSIQFGSSRVANVTSTHRAALAILQASTTDQTTVGIDRITDIALLVAQLGGTNQIVLIARRAT